MPRISTTAVSPNQEQVDFNTAFDHFLATINKAQKEYHKNSPCKYSDDPAAKEDDGFFYGPAQVDVGSKYLRVMTRSGSSRTAYCFVEKATGNIFKCASWKAPAKGVRSSIFTPEQWETIPPAHLIFGSWLYR